MYTYQIDTEANDLWQCDCCHKNPAEYTRDEDELAYIYGIYTQLCDDCREELAKCHIGY